MFWRFGFDIRRYNDGLFQETQLIKLLDTCQIDLALDVGANLGQFAENLIKSGYTGQIVSFEPLSSVHAQLAKKASLYSNWVVAQRMAIGAEEGEVALHVSENLVSSSLLNIGAAHAAAAPASRYARVETVPLRRLDVAAMSFVERRSNVFLKVDVQGYEDRVIDGAKNILPVVRALQLELSLVELYERQVLLGSMLDQMDKLGYQLWALWPGFCDPSSGRQLQVDALFVQKTQASP